MSKLNWWLCGFFLAVLGTGLPWLHAEEPAAPSAVSSENATVPAAPEESATPGVDNAVQVAQQEVRDPFSMGPAEAPGGVPGAPTGPEVTVQLQGIGFGSKDAYAVIGGDVFYKGDEKNGIKLLEVRRREVDILVNGGRITVPLFPEQDLKKAKERAKAKGATKNASEDQPEVPSSISRGEQPPL